MNNRELKKKIDELVDEFHTGKEWKIIIYKFCKEAVKEERERIGELRVTTLGDTRVKDIIGFKPKQDK